MARFTQTDSGIGCYHFDCITVDRFSVGMSWAMTNADIPYMISDALMGISDNPLVILLLINIVLLIVGIFMDMTPAVLIFTPIFLPIAQELGMDPVHFGIMMVANLCIGC